MSSPRLNEMTENRYLLDEPPRYFRGASARRWAGRFFLV